MQSFPYEVPQPSALPPPHSFLFNLSHPPPPPPHPSLPPPAYSRHPSITPSEGLTIFLKFPRLTSCKWCLKLYAMVCSGMGVIFSSLWVVGHAYVFSQTQGDSLKIQR